MDLQNHSFGTFVSYQKTKTGIQITADNGQATLTFYKNNTVRIQIHRADQKFSDHSYAVTAKAIEVPFDVKEDKRSITISSDKLLIEVSKNPVRFRFMNAKKMILNEDDSSFGTSWIGEEVTTYKKLQEDERFIGLGEKTGNIDKRGESYVNWNTDAFAFGNETDPLYISTPFYMGIHHQLVYGIFFDNTYKSTFNFGASNNRFASFKAEGGEMNYYFISGENIADLICSYVHLTGKMPMPPKWSLGYQQCRYSYYPEKKLKDIALTFRDMEIPCDVLYLDIHYMDQYKVFTWHPDRFPNPKKLIDFLNKLGFKVVIICDPGIKVEASYKQYKEGIKGNHFATYPDGIPYTATVWPGDCHFPDFTKEATRKWWGKSFTDLVKKGVKGFWNDMNEPSSWGQDTPDLIEFDFEGNNASHKKARNVYGMQMARATYEGTKQLMPNERPFVLTRAGYSGIQRFASVWTGDNTSDDDSMLLGARLISNLGLAGIPNAGYDVGGFVGETTSTLFARWISLGAFSPFFRGHTMINTRDAEPWTYGEEARDIAKNYISLRYRLIPYIYSVFHHAAQTGIPVSRSLVIDYTYDNNIYNSTFQNQYLFGPAFLVAPVSSNTEVANVYLPEGEWFNLYRDTLFKGKQQIYIRSGKDELPVFVKAGSIVPIQSTVQWMGQAPEKKLSIHFYHSKKDSHFDYYEDDGNSYDYEKGSYCLRTMTFDSKRKVFSIGKQDGKFTSHFERVRLYLHGIPKLSPTVSVNGKKVKVQFEDYRFIDMVTQFDPFFFHPDKSKVIPNLPFIEFPWIKKEIQVKW